MKFEITAEQAKRNVAQYLDTVLNIFTNYFLSHIIEKSNLGEKKYYLWDVCALYFP